MKNSLAKKILFPVFLSFSSHQLFAADNDYSTDDLQKEMQLLKQQIQDLKAAMTNSYQSESLSTNTEKKWQINSYGNVIYKSEDVFSNTQDIDPERRSYTDIERVVLEFVYDYSDQWQVEVEIEYEHGGVGAALEYDGFEEFGEFETEIEAGGEIIVEKMQLQYTHSNNFKVKMGHIFVPVGLGTDLHKPNQYFTTERHWSESTLIPQVWHETGVNLVGQWQDFTVQALVTTGLNSEYFRTYNWVATGHQKRFEKVNADDLAYTLRLDYGNIKLGSGVGLSFYTGDTTGNRNNNNKVAGDGNLTIMGLHGVWRTDNLTLKGQYLFGSLDDSQEITIANKTTPGLKPGNFAQLGSEADSGFVEAAYNVQGTLSLSKPLYAFANYEYANPTKSVEQGTSIDRFNIQEFAVGVNYFPIPEIVLKAQVAEQIYAQDNLDNTRSMSLSFGYYFSI